MSSDMLTSMLASDVESESRTWKDKQDEIEKNFMSTCHWRYINVCCVTKDWCKLDDCALWNKLKPLYLMK